MAVNSVRATHGKLELPTWRVFLNFGILAIAPETFLVAGVYRTLHARDHGLRKQFQDKESAEEKPGQSRPRDTTSREDCRFTVTSRCNRNCTAFQLSHELYVA
ncbi:hypothetical protein TNCV_764571 [Trichonephila clavipes]|nr:hypothetical protein TNCV_764571 [Trichonephila clavipes]